MVSQSIHDAIKLECIIRSFITLLSRQRSKRVEDYIDGCSHGSGCLEYNVLGTYSIVTE